MSLNNIQQTVRHTITAAAHELFSLELDQLPAEVPPRTELGDLAFPVAFDLAKRIKQATGEKRNPRQIAETLREKVLTVPGVSRVEVAGAGYLNVFFDRATLLVGGRESANYPAPVPNAPKRIVEHTNINPNKAAHIGHLRNAVLGDTFVRILRATGERVEVQNYIDNTGVQVADVVVGFMQLEGLDTVDKVRSVDESLSVSFDYYCWDLYSKVGLFYRDDLIEGKENPDKLKLRGATLQAIEAGDTETARLADYVATRIVQCHLKTMARLEIGYDVLPRESEILHLHFWDAAFKRLKEAGAIRFESEGKNAGCWVMPTDSHTGNADHDADKILVRSNGTVTYAGKDIAYQLWKLGRLGLDFHYRPFPTRSSDSEVWVSTSDEHAASPEHPSFGGGQTVYNVIDSRQSYTQEVVKKGVALLAADVGESASVHLSYEMVALSPAACGELGLMLTDEDKGRPFIEMSGRKGLGVKADDLINRLEANALAEVRTRNPTLPEADKHDIAHHVTVAALRYFLLKWTRNSLIAFDFAEALSFSGEAGPYCQYSAVRANSIFRKLAADTERQAETDTIAARWTAPGADLSAVNEILADDKLWGLLTLAARYPEMCSFAARQAEPAHLAKYVFQLAKEFNLFYHDYRIKDEPDATRRAVLVALTRFTAETLTTALETLGISVPERM